MATLYLAYGQSSNGTASWKRHIADAPLNVLVAFPHYRHWLKHRRDFNVRQWVFDSGAFTAHNAGKPVDLAEYIAACRDTDAAEIFALDAIGDAEQTRRNTEAMWEAGLPAIPTVHHGADDRDIAWACDNSEKIAVGGVARLKSGQRRNFVARVFKKVWPKRIHGFGLTGVEIMEAFPFDSVDSSTWAFGPHRYGKWAAFTARAREVGSTPLPRCFGYPDSWAEVEVYMRRERRSESQWSRQLQQLPRRVGNSVLVGNT